MEKPASSESWTDGRWLLKMPMLLSAVLKMNFCIFFLSVSLSSLHQRDAPLLIFYLQRVSCGSPFSGIKLFLCSAFFQHGLWHVVSTRSTVDLPRGSYLVKEVHFQGCSELESKLHYRFYLQGNPGLTRSLAILPEEEAKRI